MAVPASTITIRGGQQLGTLWGGGYPVIDGTGSTFGRNAVYAQSRSNCVVDGIKFSNIVYAATGEGSRDQCSRRRSRLDNRKLLL